MRNHPSRIQTRRLMAPLAVLFLLGYSGEAESKYGRKPNSAGKNLGSETSKKARNDEVECQNWHHGHCHGARDRLREARETRDRHEHDHGDRAGGWRKSAGNFCGGQRGCDSGTGSGYRGLASGLLDAASDLNGQAQKLRQAQRNIAETSISEQPGPRNQDARGFNEANENGQSRLSRYADKASDPVVKEQAKAYDALGEEIGEL